MMNYRGAILNTFEYRRASVPFIIFALPRSRTAWLSQWLAYGGRKVGHDIAIDCATPEEFLDRLSGLDGTVETGAMVAWRLIRARLPDAKFVTIRRSVEEVQRSLAALGVIADVDDMKMKNLILSRMFLEDRTTGLFSFDQLRDANHRKELFEHLIGPFDEEWDRSFDYNIQINIWEQIARLTANRDKIANLKRLAREQEAALCPTSA